MDNSGLDLQFDKCFYTTGFDQPSFVSKPDNLSMYMTKDCRKKQTGYE